MCVCCGGGGGGGGFKNTRNAAAVQCYKSSIFYSQIIKGIGVETPRQGDVANSMDTEPWPPHTMARELLTKQLNLSGRCVLLFSKSELGSNPPSYLAWFG